MVATASSAHLDEGRWRWSTWPMTRNCGVPLRSRSSPNSSAATKAFVRASSARPGSRAGCPIRTSCRCTTRARLVDAVRYELLPGRPPDRFESLAELAAVQGRGVITPPRDLEPAIPESVEAAVMHALARAPSFRPGSLADFARELAGGATEPASEPILAAGAVTEPQAPATYRGVPRKGRRLLLLAVAAAVALVVAIVLVTRRGDGRSPAAPPKRTQISTPARGATAADEARNLSTWLRSNSR